MNTCSYTSNGEASLNLFDKRHPSADPFFFLTHIRSTGAVIQIEHPYDVGQKAWAVTRMAEVVQVLKDKRFTVDLSMTNSERVYQQRVERLSNFVFPGRSMNAIDGPDHQRLRKRISKLLTPRYIEDLRPNVQRITNELLDKVQHQGRMDIVADYAAPLPLNVIADILGIPAKDRLQVGHRAEIVGSEWVNTEERLHSLQAFSDYIVQLVLEKQRQPQDDLISQLIHADDEDEHLCEDELYAMVGLLIITGYETIANFISIGTLMLLDYPEQTQKLRADVTLVPSAVEELLRFHGPLLAAPSRFATEDIDLGGQRIKKGETVFLLIASANRDETTFSRAETLDIFRKQNRHITFGHGVHFCVGAALVRLEGEIALTTLLQQMPELRLDLPRKAVMWRGAAGLGGISALPVTF